ncbi:hypothetical protein M427DRAFT_138621 [Gonapodya prolifera JEL478]|uniref:Uncharacterized protein n=1 Tax=Gonapodya prolifera (strain JEL478) TaxID=1344416 RepID=A0A139A2R3_GONPJ|nr:hypothetical protein M427DRAFT_138621 [Gonapodya prolifera JEL478]|eukprot:KXS11077.1 hypothetical protein M427DRAFT_138621 [Gonapodya prolifera JEL478]
MDALVIDAVESSDVRLVLSLLSRGASPKARKTVILKARWRVLGKDEEWKAESALALAIKKSNVEMTRALIDAGADPSSPVKLRTLNRVSLRSNPSRDTTRTNTLEFSSHLDFALTSGRLPFNPSGGRVEVTDPDSAVGWTATEPNMEIVQMLLEKGVAVTSETVKAVVKLRDGSTTLGSRRDPDIQWTRLISRHLDRRGIETPSELITPANNALDDTRSIDDDDDATLVDAPLSTNSDPGSNVQAIPRPAPSRPLPRIPSSSSTPSRRYVDRDGFPIAYNPTSDPLLARPGHINHRIPGVGVGAMAMGMGQQQLGVAGWAGMGVMGVAMAEIAQGSWGFN